MDQTKLWQHCLNRRKRKHGRIISAIVRKCIPDDYVIDWKSYATKGIDRNIIYMIKMYLSHFYPNHFRKRLNPIPSFTNDRLFYSLIRKNLTRKIKKSPRDGELAVSNLNTVSELLE